MSANLGRHLTDDGEILRCDGCRLIFAAEALQTADDNEQICDACAKRRSVIVAEWPSTVAESKSTPYLEAWAAANAAEAAEDAARAAWVAARATAKAAYAAAWVAAGTAKAACDAVWNSARTAKVAAEAAVKIAAKAANDARAAYLAKPLTPETP